MPEKRPWKPTSILLDEATKALLDARDPVPRRDDAVPFAARSQGNRSVIIREIVRRYDEVCRKEMPALSAEDRKILREAGRDGPAAGATSFGILLDAVRRQGSEGEKLMMRILSLTGAQQMAVLDDVERHWAGKRRDEATRRSKEALTPKNKRHAKARS